jgi:predicted DNA-binding transcriptional regulator AlpA
MTQDQTEKLIRISGNISALGKRFIEDVFFQVEAALRTLESDPTVNRRNQIAASGKPVGLVDRKHLATLLGISERSICDLQNEGLPCHRFGRSVRFDHQEVLRWCQDRSKKHSRNRKLRVVA